MFRDTGESTSQNLMKPVVSYPFYSYFREKYIKNIEKHGVYKHSAMRFHDVAKPWNSLGKLTF